MKTKYLLAFTMSLLLADLHANDEKLEALVSKEEAAAIKAEAEKPKTEAKPDSKKDEKARDADEKKSDEMKDQEAKDEEEAENKKKAQDHKDVPSRYEPFKDYTPSNQIDQKPGRSLGSTPPASRPLKGSRNDGGLSR